MRSLVSLPLVGINPFQTDGSRRHLGERMGPGHRDRPQRCLGQARVDGGETAGPQASLATFQPQGPSVAAEPLQLGVLQQLPYQLKGIARLVG